MTMITPSYLGETIEYSSLHACRSTLEDPTVGPSEAMCLASAYPWHIAAKSRKPIRIERQAGKRTIIGFLHPAYRNGSRVFYLPMKN